MKTKADILMKHFNTTDSDEIWKMRRSKRPYPAEDFVSQKFPYIAPGSHDIPTIQDVHDHGVPLHSPNGCSAVVYKVFDRYAVKVTSKPWVLQTKEAENLIFLENFPRLHTAKVHALLEEARGLGKVYYLVMDHIPGQVLSPEYWATLDDDGKRLFGAKMGAQLKELRNIPQSSKEPFYGRINGKGWTPWLPLLSKFGGGLSGPFSSYEDLTKFMAGVAEIKAAAGCVNDELAEKTLQMLEEFESTLNKCAQEDQRPVLTHLDLKPDNIMIRPAQNSTEADDYDVVVIDWEFVGWLPAWLEGTTLLNSLTWAFQEPETERDVMLEDILREIGPLNMELAQYLSSTRYGLC